MSHGLVRGCWFWSCPAQPHLTAPPSRHWTCPCSVLFKDLETEASWLVITVHSSKTTHHTLTLVYNRNEGCVCVNCAKYREFPTVRLLGNACLPSPTPVPVALWWPNVPSLWCPLMSHLSCSSEHVTWAPSTISQPRCVRSGLGNLRVSDKGLVHLGGQMERVLQARWPDSGV